MSSITLHSQPKYEHDLICARLMKSNATKVSLEKMWLQNFRSWTSQIVQMNGITRLTTCQTQLCAQNMFDGVSKSFQIRTAIPCSSLIEASPNFLSVANGSNFARRDHFDLAQMMRV